MQYLVGSPKELAAVWKAWGVGSEREVGHPDLVEHTGIVYGITGSGKRWRSTRPTSRPTTWRTTRRSWRPSRERSMSRRAVRRVALAVLALAAIALVAVFGLAGTKGVAGRGAPRAAPRTARRCAHHAGRRCSPPHTASRCWSCSGRAGAGRARTRRPRLSASRAAAQGRARIVGVDWSDARSGARSFISQLQLDVSQRPRRRRHGGERLRADGAADHLRDRRPRTASWPNCGGPRAKPRSSRRWRTRNGPAPLRSEAGRPGSRSARWRR